MKKVLVIGIDGVSYSRIIENLDSLPFFKDLHERCCLNKLSSVIPPVTGPAWSSSYTGKNPGRFGVCGMFKINPQTYKPEAYSAADRFSKDIYEIVSDLGGKVVVLGMPYTFPPRVVDGILISGYSKAGGYPEELTKRLMEKYEYEILPSATIDPEYIKKAIEKRFNMAKEVFQEYQWDLAMLGFEHLEITHHNLLVTDPQGVDFLYRSIDEQLRLFLLSFGDDITVIMYSDHGHRVYAKRFYISRWLKKKGFLRLRSKEKVRAFRKEYEENQLKKIRERSKNIFEYFFSFNLFFIKRFLLRYFPNLKYPVLLRKLSIFTQANVTRPYTSIEYSQSRAFSARGFVGRYGGIYINAKDAFKDGIVEGSEEYNRVRDEIMSELKKEEAVLDVWKKEDIVHGDFTGGFPDVYFRCKDDYVAMDTMINIEREDVIENLSLPSHEKDGFFGAKGKYINNNSQEDMSILDIMPTILCAMGLAVPKDLDGKVIDKIFTKEFIKDNPVVYQDINTEASADEIKNISMSEEEDIRNRLKGLGYID